MSASPSTNLKLRLAGRERLHVSQPGKLFSFPLCIKPLLPGSDGNSFLKEQQDNKRVLRVDKLF